MRSKAGSLRIPHRLQNPIGCSTTTHSCWITTLQMTLTGEHLICIVRQHARASKWLNLQAQLGRKTAAVRLPMK